MNLANFKNLFLVSKYEIPAEGVNQFLLLLVPNCCEQNRLII